MAPGDEGLVQDATCGMSGIECSPCHPPVSQGCVWPQCCRDAKKRSCPQYASVSRRNVFGELMSRKLPQALVIDRCDEPGGPLCVGSWVPDGTGSPCFCVCWGGGVPHPLPLASDREAAHIPSGALQPGISEREPTQPLFSPFCWVWSCLLPPLEYFVAF